MSIISDAAQLAIDGPKLTQIVQGDASVTVVTNGGNVPSMSRLLARMGAGSVRGAWVTVTAYALGDVVTSGGTAYRCVLAHTSAAAFATDLAASKWIVHYTATSQVDTMAALKAAANTYGSVLVLGYYAPGDGGGGIFTWNAADASADNLGTVIIPASAPGTGRWNRLYSGALDVRWFGAKGDGVTDDTTAVQTAVNSLATLGGGVLFPVGTFLTDRIYVKYSNISLFGVGRASILKSKTVLAVLPPFDGVAGGLVNVYPATGYTWGVEGTKISGVTISNMQLVGKFASVQPFTSGYQGLMVESCHDFHMTDVWFSGFAGENMLIGPSTLCNYPSVKSCHFIQGGEVGINKSFGAVFTGNQVSDSWSMNGVGLSGSQWIFSNNVISNMAGGGASCGGSGTDGVSGYSGIIDGNTIYNCGLTIVAPNLQISDDGATTVRKTNIVVSNNIITRSGCNYVLGLQMALATSTCHIRNNVISEGNAVTATVGMLFVSGSATYYVSGNVITPGLAPQNQQFGVQIASGTPVVWLHNNIITGHSGGNIQGSGFTLGFNVTAAGFVDGPVRYSNTIRQPFINMAQAATLTCDTSRYNAFRCVLTTGTAMTIGPTTTPLDGQEITISIFNATGGAHGAITWDASFATTGAPTIANNKRRVFKFVYNGSAWEQVGPAPTDV